VSRPLRVGLDARELQGHPTGTGRYLRSLLRHWTREGDGRGDHPHGGDEFVAYLSGPVPDDPVLRHERILVRAIGESASRGLVWQQRDLPRAAAADGLDVFFSPAYSCPLHLDLPRVTAVHDLSFYSWPSDFTFSDALRRRATVSASIRASAAVLACSAFTAREIAARFPDAEPRVAHVPLGADDDLHASPERAAVRARRGLRGPLLLTVGAILNRRCLPTLLQGVALLRRQGVPVSLDVVGENRTHPPLDIPSLVRRLGLGSAVTMVGYASEADLAERYAAADVAVFLSEYEGFGLPALEAAARGVPLVVADRPALSEVAGPAAQLVEPRDASALADAVRRLLDDEALRSELVARGRALASRYSWAETARRTREVLAKAAGA
jgi:glycosyltransferase involved in cell wall biosynthesis